ncbi:MAG: DMT family transporter [Dokdonella sp.]
MRVIVLTTLAMIAFAANSVLCRLALKETSIDPATFAAIRLVAGALALALIVRLRTRPQAGDGNWLSALALFAYAAAFSFAYVGLSAAAGALVLFGAVQVTMIGYGLWNGERLRAWQRAGVLLAVAGLVGFLLPGLSAPPISASVLMLIAGMAWGGYSLRGRGAGDPVGVTAGNFLRTVPMAIVLVIATLVVNRNLAWDAAGISYAIASGAITSGIGYAIWYATLPALKSTTAAIVQLSVPLIAALGGVVALAEPISARLAVASVAVLGGIALVTTRLRSTKRAGNEPHR